MLSVATITQGMNGKQLSWTHSTQRAKTNEQGLTYINYCFEQLRGGSRETIMCSIYKHVHKIFGELERNNKLSGGDRCSMAVLVKNGVAYRTTIMHRHHYTAATNRLQEHDGKNV